MIDIWSIFINNEQVNSKNGNVVNMSQSILLTDQGDLGAEL
jgi:hypothetical protein